MIATVLGAIILLAAFILLILGVAVVGIGGEGLRIRPSALETDTHAIVFQDINLDLDDASESWSVWSPGDIVTVELIASSNDPSKSVLIGIAEASGVAPYLSDVEYDEVVDWRGIEFAPFRVGEVEAGVRHHTGDAAPADPAGQDFWAVSAHGSGSQQLEWSPETGEYWVVLMNEDGSAGVDADLELVLSSEFLSALIGGGLLAGGLVGLLIGGVLIYFGVRSAGPAPTAPTAPHEAGDYLAMPKGSFLHRLVALVIDVVCVNLIQLLVAVVVGMPLLLGGLTLDPSEVVARYGLVSAVTTLIGLAYFVYFWGAKGATPGKMAVGLKIVGTDGTMPIGYLKAFVRYIGFIISGIIIFLGYLLIIVDADNQGLHDKIASTYVVSVS
jgi:uncharacterized RDD family membrane protein YckC